MTVVLQLDTAAVVPLNVTLPFPWLGPKFKPLIVTEEPTVPEFGTKLLMAGGGVIVNATPLLATPPAAVTTTVFVPAGFMGTTARICVALQLLTVAVVP